MCQLLTRSRARYTAIGEASWSSGMNATICLALSQWEIPLKSRGFLHVLKGFTGLGPTEGRTDCWSIKWDWTKNLAPFLLPNPEGCLWFISGSRELGHWKEGSSADQVAISSLVGCCHQMTFSYGHLGAPCRVFVHCIFFFPNYPNAGSSRDGTRSLIIVAWLLLQMKSHQILISNICRVSSWVPWPATVAEQQHCSGQKINHKDCWKEKKRRGWICQIKENKLDDT